MIYLDHSATTPVDKEVLKKMLPYFSDDFGNPSSIHSVGQKAAQAVEEARIKVADFLNCEAEEVIFTSGATESDNLAINGIIMPILEAKKARPHVIVSCIEHPAILAPCQRLEKLGVEVTYLPVDNKGVVNCDDIIKNIKDNTVLVSIMYVNNEIGSIQPIREIGKIIKKINKDREEKKGGLIPLLANNKPSKIYFHTDAVQAANFLDCDVKKLHVDLLSISGHKIYGPKGIGALFVKKGTPIKAIQLGGHQERNIRSGTLNVSGIAGLGEACFLAKKNREENNNKILNLRKILVEGILKNIPESSLNTDLENSSPSHANISFRGAEGEAVLIALDMEGIAVSTGSACASGSLNPSHVLSAIGLSEENSHGSIRFTLGKNNTEEEIKKTLEMLPQVIERLRKISVKY